MAQSAAKAQRIGGKIETIRYSICYEAKTILEILFLHAQGHTIPIVRYQAEKAMNFYVTRWRK